MSLARVTVRAAFGEGSGCEPLATGGDPLPQLGVAHGKAVEKETVGTNHRLRRDGKYEIPAQDHLIGQQRSSSYTVVTMMRP